MFCNHNPMNNISELSKRTQRQNILVKCYKNLLQNNKRSFPLRGMAVGHRPGRTCFLSLNYFRVFLDFIQVYKRYFLLLTKKNILLMFSSTKGKKMGKLVKKGKLVVQTAIRVARSVFTVLTMVVYLTLPLVTRYSAKQFQRQMMFYMLSIVTIPK